ncbi:ACP phosphodiesterase [Halomonas sp. PAMB 3264]|uniref:acyl carrier protein phosphodiesterase n=1 Tax=Halomonas sp. PAMB 3264 TaxID=3075222 RepID=UPI0028A01C8A|nr:ACP phosphodiesterase [Halomonas sp. PAMB 3264]WNL41150.1 ACP phosphodiesterase [Halomonas sp. PAMB 3264]
MNFLAHALLARRGSDGFLLGNVIADGVKGSDLAPWPSSVAAGIRHHRRVDAFVDSHARVKGVKASAPAGQRRFAGIALDVLWDHFLARELIGTAEFEALVARLYTLLEREGAPNRLAAMMPALIEQDWLHRYADFDFTCRAIAGLGQRLSGPNRLAELTPWLDHQYGWLEAQFEPLWADCLERLDATGNERPATNG